MRHKDLVPYYLGIALHAHTQACTHVRTDTHIHSHPNLDSQSTRKYLVKSIKCLEQHIADLIYMLGRFPRPLWRKSIK